MANAYELKISKENTKKWKHTLNKVINNKDIPICDGHPILSEEEYRNQLIEILNFLYNEKKNYPLFEKSINQFVNNINVEYLGEEEIVKVINQLLVLYKCNSKTVNLSEFGFNNIGRLADKNITSGTIIFKSTTGLKEYKYEF